MAKSPDAFRTISEVADWLGLQAHVLRFWESKFAQVKPVKRAGGRRYYRPADMLLLGGIKKLLHDDGMTIKGTQKLLREKGVSFVADLSQPLDDLTMAVIEDDHQPDIETEDIVEDAAADAEPVAAAPDIPQTAPPIEEDVRADDAPMPTEPPAAAQTEMPTSAPTPPATAEEDPVAPLGDTFDTGTLDTGMPPTPEPASATPSAANEEAQVADESDDMMAVTAEQDTAMEGSTPIPEELETPPEAAETPVHTPELATGEAVEHQGVEAAPFDPVEIPQAEPEPQSENAPDRNRADDNVAAPPMPSFRARARTTETSPPSAPEPQDPPQQAPELDLEAPQPEPEAAEEPVAPVPPKPRLVDVPRVPPLSEIEVSPSALSMLARLRKLSPEHVREVKPHLARLTRLRASMANPRKDAAKD
ncbi:MAG: MerR family transcriptional regulator [Pseudomonadota bacterium]